MAQEDLQKLRFFISDVREVLKVIVPNIDLLVTEPGDVPKLIREAWKEVEPRFDMMLRELDVYLAKKEEPGHGEIFEAQLRERGLTGNQLKLKLRIFDTRKQEFYDEWAQFENLTDQQKKRKRGFMGGVIDRILRIIQRILRSLLGLLGGAEAVDEFKGMIEEVISK